MALTGLAMATLVALLAGLVWGLGRVVQILSPVLWPLAVAAVLACLLDPLVGDLAQRRVPRTRAIVYVFVLAIVLLAGIAASILPQAIAEGEELTARIPAYALKMQHRVENWVNHPPLWLRQHIEARKQTAAPALSPSTNPPSADLAPAAEPRNREISWIDLLDSDALQSVGTSAAKALPAAATWLLDRFRIVGSAFSLLAGLALIPIYTFYFLKEKAGITAQWHSYLPLADSKFKTELIFVLNSINEYLVAFFRGQVLVGICNGIAYMIGFALIGMPYAILLGLMAIFLTIIPFIGAITTCAIALLIAIPSFEDWRHPLLVLLVVCLVQSLESVVISPKIMGDRVGLHPVVIIVALMTGTVLLGGLLGGILAIPLAAALRVVLFRYVWKKRTDSELDPGVRT